jgi:hypothetical protein
MTGATPATRGLKPTPKKAGTIHPRWPTLKELMDEHDRRAKLKMARI